MFVSEVLASGGLAATSADVVDHDLAGGLVCGGFDAVSAALRSSVDEAADGVLVCGGNVDGVAGGVLACGCDFVEDVLAGGGSVAASADFVGVILACGGLPPQASMSSAACWCSFATVLPP